MQPALDDPKPTAAPVRTGRSVATMPKQADLPDIYAAPKRRLHPTFVAGLGFVAAGAVFYGAQMFAPDAFKPASIIGGYDTEILEARKAGELAAQIRYDAQLRNVELQHQGQLRQIETAAVQWQEQYRTVMAGTLENYRATWTRANIFAQATADLQKQYAQVRYDYTRSTLRGERDMANTASTFGFWVGLIDPALGEAAQGYADRVRGQALDRLDQAASSGVTISVEGWDTGLTDPDELARQIYDLPPLQLPDFQPRPVTVQPVFVPREGPTRETRP